MRLKVLTCLIAVTFAGISTSQQSVAQTQSPVDMLDAALTKAVSTSRAGAVLDVQGCGVSFLEARGVANRKTKAAMPTDEQLRLASIGKLYTAAVIHELVKEGKLDLDAPATRYVTDGQLAGVPNADASLRQMLNHTSGVPDYYDFRSYFFNNWKKPITPAFTLKVAKRRKATNAPGEGYAYSNTNYQILALVAEAVTGETFKALAERYVLAPLGLEDTRYNVVHPGGIIRGYGTELRKNADTWIYAENTGADGGITATTADLGKFLRAYFLAGEKKEIGAALASSRVPADGARREDGAGAEVYIGRDGLELIGHTGDTMGYLSFAFAIPEYGATMIGHINADREEAFVSLLTETARAVRAACAPEHAQ